MLFWPGVEGAEHRAVGNCLGQPGSLFERLGGRCVLPMELGVSGLRRHFTGFPFHDLEVEDADRIDHWNKQQRDKGY